MKNKNKLVNTYKEPCDTSNNVVNNINKTLNNSISISKVDNNKNIIPIVKYINAETDKSLIYRENKKKSGVYRWINKVNGKSYVGSSISLKNRFSIYFSLSSLKLKVKGSSIIYRALLKYGYSKFSLDILEYCDSSVLIAREQYYIDLLKPEYNILKIANSKIGSKHSEKTRAQMSINNTGINHPFYGKRHTYESRKMIGESLRSIVRVNNKPKVVTLETKIKVSLRSQGVSVKVFDSSNNLINEFPSKISLAKHFNISTRTVGRYLDKDIVYNGFFFKSYANNK